VRARRPFEARVRMRRADGEYRWMKASGLPRLLNDELVGYVGCTFDITDMKEAEEALMELDRGKNEFLAMLSHELRNPLSAIRNASHLLAGARDGPVIERAHAIIERQTGHMVRMVDDLLDVSRITHSKIELQLEPVDLAAVARRSVETTASAREEKSLQLSATLPEVPVWVEADPMRLDQLLTNLLDNAAKFTRPGGQVWITLEREMVRVGGASQPRATVRVRDNGAGIDPSVLPRIFDLFVQADRSSARARAGIGLGLTLARRLVELHGGTIEAFSAGNALGSEFVVRLPLLPESRVGSAREPARASARTNPAAPRRVLIVDDNRDSADGLRLMLEAAGHQVQVVWEGAEAEGAVASFRPHVVLLDIGLPDLDGHDVARRLRAARGGRELRIVAVTGFGREADMRRSREAGIDEHLTKPLDPRDLEAILRGGARQKRAR
jgi:signal transduction histidine kinase/ActR/RegA family two-component response regulator